jgi:hypothetical protein
VKTKVVGVGDLRMRGAQKRKTKSKKVLKEKNYGGVVKLLAQ